MAIDRAELRDWLEANCPPEMREPAGEGDICWGGRRWVFQSEAQKLWLERCAQRGLTVPTWPKEYGGAGYSREDAAVLREEMQRIHARPPLVSFGIWMLGPALLKFGSPEQKATHLPRIARGEIRWCQGYSEPGAGSDLASLRTKAEDRGDHFLVNGQKIWTSYADKADWIFCLVQDRSAGGEAEGHFVPAHRHGEPGGVDQADRPDLGRFAILRNVLRRRRRCRRTIWSEPSIAAGTSPNIS